MFLLFELRTGATFRGEHVWCSSATGIASNFPPCERLIQTKKENRDYCTLNTIVHFFHKCLRLPAFSWYKVICQTHSKLCFPTHTSWIRVTKGISQLRQAL